MSLFLVLAEVRLLGLGGLMGLDPDPVNNGLAQGEVEGLVPGLSPAAAVPDDVGLTGTGGGLEGLLFPLGDDNGDDVVLLASF